MSIAASLATLRREGQAILQNPPNVNLTKLPLSSSLSDRAASARNALTLLSTADPLLPTFEHHLHLSDTSFDRTTLPPNAQKALSTAVTTVSLRLTPFFLTRPCTALLEWLLQTLQLSVLGSTEEIDALMLCALPFQETEQFLAVARILLRSPNAKTWRWLLKRIKSGRLVDIPFCVENAPLGVFRLIIARAVQSVKEGVAVTPLAALITNFVGRRMASEDRPVLTVLCVDALVTLHGEKQASQHLLCALLAALAAAVSHDLELPIAQTVASATAQCFSSSDASSETVNTSIALLALCLRQHETCLSSKDAKMLLRTHKLQTALHCLGPRQSVDTYRDIIRCVIVSGTPSEKLLRLIKNSLQAEQLLSAESTSHLVQNLLEACAMATDENSQKFAQERIAHLSSLLTTLFKGSFSEAVDDVLYNHLVSRRVRKQQKKKFHIIDAALSTALDEIISGRVKDETAEGHDGSYPLAIDVLCLSHPDKKRRKHALESIGGRELVNDCTNEQELRRLVARLIGIIQSERNLGLVSTALENVSKMPVHLISSGVIKAMLTRCSSKGIKDCEHSPERDKLALALVGLCERIASEKSVIVPAIVLLLSFEGLLERCCEDNEGRERIKRLLERFGVTNGRKLKGSSTESSPLTKDVTESIAQMILKETDNFSDIFSTVADLDEKWIVQLSELWLKVLWAKLATAETSDELGIISQRILNLANLHPKVAEGMIRSLGNDVESILGTPESPKRESAVSVWGIASELLNWEYQEAVLTYLIKVLGLNETTDILKKGCFDLSRSSEARQRSLEWYINFCVVHPDDEVGKEAVVTSSRIAYGDDSNMRLVLLQIWSRRAGLNRKKRERKCILWDFLQLLSSIPEQPSHIDPIDADVRLLYTEMQELAGELASRIGTIRAPLHDGSFGTPNRKAFENHLASKLLSQKQIQDGDLYLLRALGGGFFAGRDDRGKLYSLLESTLLQFSDSGSDSGYPMVAIESVYRLAVLIVSSGRLSDPKLKVRSLAKIIASTFQAIATASKPPEPILSTSLLCLMGFMISFTVPKRFPEKDSLIDLLLAHSILSTSTGACARRITNSFSGEIITGKVLHHHLKNLILAKNLRSTSPHPGALNAGDSNAQLSAKAALGAVRAIDSWVGRSVDGLQKIDLSLLKSSLSVLWKFIKTLHEDHEGKLSSPETRDPEQLTVVLNTLATLHRAISKKDIRKGREAAMEADFDSLINVAFTQESVDPIADLPVNPAVRFLRDAGHDLVGVLVSNQEAGARHVLPRLLLSQTFAGDVSLITNLLERVMPTLISEEKDLCEISKLLGDTAYNESSELPREARMKIMRTMLRARGPTVGALDITKACLREVYNREHQISDPSAAVKECSWFLQESHLACDEDIDCMVFMENDLDCRITCVHFVNPKFLAKLASIDEVANARKISSVDEGLSRLFVALLGLSRTTEKDSAIRLLLVSIPLSGMLLCARAALESEVFKVRIGALHYLGERIGTESLPLLPTWRSISEGSMISAKTRREIETSFLDGVGRTLCDFVNIVGASTDEIEIREVAVDTLRRVSQRLGSASYSVVQAFASQISILSSDDSEVIRSLSDEPGRGLILRGKVLECLAAFTFTLGKYSLPFVPYLLESSFAVLEEFCGLEQKRVPDPKEKNFKPSVFVTASSIKALTAILTSCPMFFGGKALRRLILLALQTEIEAPRELLRELAARKVPVDVFVSVFGNFAALDDGYLRNASVSGLLGLVKSISSGVGRMYKSEIKVNWQKILNVLLRCMDCSQDVSGLLAEEVEAQKEVHSNAMEQNGNILPPRSISEQKKNRLENCRQLDSACAEVLMKMVLKLSESEFEGLFKALLQWFDSGSLPDAAITACEDCGTEVEKNLPRTLPFFALIGELLSVLKTIMMPYFVQLITRMTTIIGRKIPKYDGLRRGSDEKEGSRLKKRSRAAIDDGGTCSILISEQSCLRDTCLTLLASFFNIDFTEGMVSARVVGELQEALLVAFDDLDGDSENVSKALQGLARRMLLPGVSSDTKKNQDMLTGLVREVLSRTRESNARLRAGALNTCKDMGVAVGDEFVCTLPESMPILAEVIDDEESAVTKAAERYVLLLESMTGEPILQQLK